VPLPLILLSLDLVVVASRFEFASVLKPVVKEEKESELIFVVLKSVVKEEKESELLFVEGP